MGKVLIIDSSKVTASFIARTLRRAEFECHMAYTYEEAKLMLAENNYFAGLSSIFLEDSAPGKGIDLLIEHNVPAIAVTSSLDEEVLNEISKKDIVDYVLKKSDHAEYIDRIVRRLYKNKGLKVLVVDDSQSVRNWITEILSKQGIEALSASDGREACRVFYKNPDIKLVLTDYAMPHMDGLQLTAHLRTIKPMDKLGIIVLSSDSKSRTAPLFLKTGANDFIHKSASVEEILCRVNSNLENLELLQESRDRANKDFLTGIWNRRYFFEHSEPLCKQYQREGLPLSLAILDIDHFKRVNDSFGHDAGDMVLKQFAALLTEFTGDKGFAARFGGEEFTVILDAVSDAELFPFMNNFRKKIENHIMEHNGETIKVTVSIGCTSVKGKSLSEMIARADANLYEAKMQGRNMVLCY